MDLPGKILFVDSYHLPALMTKNFPFTGCVRLRLEPARVGAARETSSALSRPVSRAERYGVHPCLRTGVAVEHQVLL
jgi:hypothetical protein